MQHLFIPRGGLYSVLAFNPNDVEQMQCQEEPNEAPASPPFVTRIGLDERPIYPSSLVRIVYSYRLRDGFIISVSCPLKYLSMGRP